MKNILVLYYTQSGQLFEIINQITKPLKDHAIIYHKIEMVKEFPFPWDRKSFFDAFPETFLQLPQDIKPIPHEILSKDFDLIFVAYQTWYLSPSIPITSFLKSNYAQTLLKEKSVITLSGNRNMWALAQEKVAKLIKDNKAQLVGNIALSDKNLNHVSVLTILHWMFSGKKTRYLGIFPLPGVKQEDINQSDRFGEIINKYIILDNYDGMQDELIANGAVDINHFLISADKKGNKIFNFWANIIYGNKHRQFLLRLFSIYLWLAIWCVMPLVFIFYIITYPIKVNKIKRELKYYRGI